MIVDLKPNFTSVVHGDDGPEPLEKHWLYKRELPCLQLPKLKMGMKCDTCGKPIKRWPIVVVLWKMKPYYVHESGGCFNNFIFFRYRIEKECGERPTYEHENRITDL